MEANILVVDDEPEIADLVEVYLQSEGCTVYKCNTGTQALAVVNSRSVDLAILDVMLPRHQRLYLVRGDPQGPPFPGAHAHRQGGGYG